MSDTKNNINFKCDFCHLNLVSKVDRLVHNFSGHNYYIVLCSNCKKELHSYFEKNTLPEVLREYILDYIERN